MNPKFLSNSVSTWFIISYHALLIILLPLYLYLFRLPSITVLLSIAVLFFFTGMGVTAGYHRLYSHKAYQTNKVIEAILLFFGTLSLEGSALKWSFQHRIHHRFVDSEQDPYSIRKGFWYAHILWIFQDKCDKIDEKVVPDLISNKLVMFQNKYYPFLAVISNFLMFIAFGYAFNDYFASFVFSFLLRVFIVHHFTWFINSLAHTWGSKSYSKEHSAVDNFIISLVSFGEGYHNYHHSFASDYRNGILWFNFDPTKWIIWTLSKLGLAKSLVKIDTLAIKRKLMEEDKLMMIDKLKHINAKESLETAINSMAERITNKIAEIRNIKFKFKDSSKEEQQILKNELKTQYREFKLEWKDWIKLVNSVMSRA